MMESIFDSLGCCPTVMLAVDEAHCIFSTGVTISTRNPAR
jgi:superfamily II DNA helicase RecQ